MAIWALTLGATSPWDLPSCLTSVDLTTARILSPSRIAALLVLRMRPAAPSDGTYLVRELGINCTRTCYYWRTISFICKCSTSRVAWSHLLCRQKSMIKIRRGKQRMKSYLPKCTGPVIKVEKLDESGTSEKENGLPCMRVGATDNCGLCLTRLKVLDGWRYHQHSGLMSSMNDDYHCREWSVQTWVLETRPEPLPISLPHLIHPDGVCIGGVVVTRRRTECKRKLPTSRLQARGVVID